MTFRWLDFKITNRCNNNCVYCGVKHDPPSFPEILSIEDIKNTLSDAISLGFTHVALLGGEPSIRTDVDKIFSEFENCPWVTLLVITNGLLFNERMYREVFASGAGVAKIVYSFDSFVQPNYKHQDSAQVLVNIDKIFEISQEYHSDRFNRGIEIHSVISRENYHNFSDLVEYFCSRGIEVSLALVCPSEFGHDCNPKEYNHFTYGELGIILAQLRGLKKRGLLNFSNRVLLDYLEKYPYGKLELSSICKAGKEHVIINFDGEVYPCVTESYRRGIRYGNIKEIEFQEIYTKMKDFKCENEFAPACWDHFLWNRLGEHIEGRSPK